MLQYLGRREDHEASSEGAGEEQQQAGGFSLKEMVTGRIISNSNSNEYKVNKINLSCILVLLLLTSV